MATKTISITEGRKQLFKIAEKVQRPDTRYIFTIDGEPEVILMSVEEFDSMLETMEILSDPKILEDIKKAEEEIDKGEYYTLDEIKEEFGFVDKEDLILVREPKKKYKAKKRKK